MDNLGGREQLRELAVKLDVLKCVKPGRLHPLVLREMAGVIVRPLSIVFKLS